MKRGNATELFRWPFQRGYAAQRVKTRYKRYRQVYRHTYRGNDNADTKESGRGSAQPIVLRSDEMRRDATAAAHYWSHNIIIRHNSCTRREIQWGKRHKRPRERTHGTKGRACSINVLAGAEETPTIRSRGSDAPYNTQSMRGGGGGGAGGGGKARKAGRQVLPPHTTCSAT